MSLIVLEDYKEPDRRHLYSAQSNKVVESVRGGQLVAPTTATSGFGSWRRLWSYSGSSHGKGRTFVAVYAIEGTLVLSVGETSVNLLEPGLVIKRRRGILGWNRLHLHNEAGDDLVVKYFFNYHRVWPSTNDIFDYLEGVPERPFRTYSWWMKCAEGRCPEDPGFSDDLEHREIEAIRRWTESRRKE